MATQLFKVGWDSLSLPGWASIPKASFYTTADTANSFAARLLEAGKVNVYIQPPAIERLFWPCNPKTINPPAHKDCSGSFDFTDGREVCTCPCHRN